MSISPSEKIKVSIEGKVAKVVREKRPGTPWERQR